MCYSLFCLILAQAAKAFLSSDGDVLDRKESDMNDNSTRFKHHYLNKAISVLNCNILDGELLCVFSPNCSPFTPMLVPRFIWSTFPIKSGSGFFF